MTKKEYEQVCKLIDDYTTLIYANYNTPLIAIDSRGIEQVKDKLKEIVKWNKNIEICH